MDNPKQSIRFFSPENGQRDSRSKQTLAFQFSVGKQENYEGKSQK